MKTLKVITVLFLFVLALPGYGQVVQYVTLVSTNGHSVPFAMQTNQAVSFVGAFQISNSGLYGYFPDGTPFQFPAPSSGSPQIFTGMTNIVLGGATGYTVCATLQITTTPSANVISNYVPADAIVIPASATGTVQIILESSTDLVNWTAANPGIYSAASATNRFFRVRAVHN